MRRAAGLLALAASLAWADAGPGEFAYRAPITADTPASHYRFTLPAQAYEARPRRDLGDVRIFNAAGEAVPYAFVQRDPVSSPPIRQPVKFFPLYGDAAKGLDATAIRVERNPRGTVVNVSVSERPAVKGRRLLGYVIDSGEVKTSKQALLVDWDTAQSFTAEARVEATDDFKSWYPIATRAPVLSLQHAGAILERSRIELASTPARYLRLAFTGVPERFTLKQIRLELRAETPLPEREWKALPGQSGKAPGEWLFDSAGHYPVDRVRVKLPEPNTVVQVQFLTRERPEDSWRRVASAIAYRLAGENGELNNPEIVLGTNLDRYWLVRVEQKGGGIGSGALGLDIGWLPQEVVFAARGSGPFTVAFGNEKEKPGALPLASVLPSRPDGVSLKPQAAKVGPVSGASDEPTLLGQPLRYVEHLAARRDVKKWALWSALVGGVLLLGWMAFRLMGDMARRK